MSSHHLSDRVGEPRIGALLRAPWQAIRARIVDGLDARGYRDVGPAHLNVLQYPTPDGLRPSDLAGRSQMTKQALNRLIRHLERRGYVRLEPDPSDQRARIIRLTERGWELHRAIQSIVTEVEEDWARRLGERRFRALRGALVELGEIAHGPGPDGGPRRSRTSTTG